MPRPLFALLFAASLAVPLGAQTTPASAPAAARGSVHLVLVSVDGLRPEFYLDPTWPAPTLQQLAREGAHARGVRGVFPTVTYPSHTTLVTGALPRRHGVFYNEPFEPAGQTGRWYWEASAIRVPTLWDAVRAAGLRSAAISWPVTVGAPIDFNLPEVWSLDRTADPLAATRAAATPGLLEELEREATGRLSGGTFSADYLTREDRLGAMAAYLLEAKRPALLAVHLAGADHFQHAEGRDGPLVRRSLGAVDRAIGQILDAAERAGIRERLIVIVTGDHGFVNVRTRVQPNVWLAEAGLLDTTRTRGPGWRAAFHASGGSAFLHLRAPGDSAAVRIVRTALRRLTSEQHALFRVVERPELDRIGADPAAVFALSAAPGTIFGAGASGAAVRAATGGTHGHFPDFPEIMTGFLAWGAGVRPGVRLDQITMEQIAPTIASALGLAGFQSLDGRSLWEGVADGQSLLPR